MLAKQLQHWAEKQPEKTALQIRDKEGSYYSITTLDRGNSNFFRVNKKYRYPCEYQRNRSYDIPWSTETLSPINPGLSFPKVSVTVMNPIEPAKGDKEARDLYQDTVNIWLEDMQKMEMNRK